MLLILVTRNILGTTHGPVPVNPATSWKGNLAYLTNGVALRFFVPSIDYIGT
jgi:hypothetical protein